MTIDQSRTEATQALLAVAETEAHRVTSAARADLEQILTDVESWVNMDSPTFEVALVDHTADAIAARLRDYGCNVELVDAGTNGRYLHSWIEGSGTARVALLGHHDTVFPVGTAAARPFSRDATRIYGPGVCDMKGGIAVAVHAMRLLAQGDRRFARVELVSVPDEEEREGGPETLERLAGFDAVLTLECGRANHAIVSSRKGGRWIRVEANGRAAHAGVAPAEGRNAVLALAAEAQRVAQIDGQRAGLTAHLTAMSGGGSINTIPDRASMTFDIRGLTEDDLEWAVKTVNDRPAIDGISFTHRMIGWTPPMERTASVARLAAAAIEIGRRVGLDFTEESTGGASDGSWAAHAGLPTIDGMGPTGDLDHTESEYAVIDTFPARCGIIAGLVTMIDSGLLTH
jgi:glutamate carboxypeptidase